MESQEWAEDARACMGGMVPEDGYNTAQRANFTVRVQ